MQTKAAWKHLDIIWALFFSRVTVNNVDVVLGIIVKLFVKELQSVSLLLTRRLIIGARQHVDWLFGKSGGVRIPEGIL